MMDMGSALLSAETALELLAPEIAAKVRLCAAPLVERYTGSNGQRGLGGGYRQSYL